jgi:YggT family protein
MFVIGNFLMAFAQVLDIILNIYMWVIIIAALISWVNPDPYNPIVRFLYRATEPVLRPIRRTIGTALGGIDVSPIIAILGIMFLRYFIVRSLIDIAARLR